LLARAVRILGDRGFVVFADGDFDFILLSFCFVFLAGEHAAGCVRRGRRCREGHAGDPVGENALREGSVPGDEDEELQELPEPKLRPGGCFAGTN